MLNLLFRDTYYVPEYDIFIYLWKLDSYENKA